MPESGRIWIDFICQNLAFTDATGVCAMLCLALDYIISSYIILEAVKNL